MSLFNGVYLLAAGSGNHNSPTSDLMGKSVKEGGRGNCHGGVQRKGQGF